MLVGRWASVQWSTGGYDFGRQHSRNWTNNLFLQTFLHTMALSFFSRSPSVIYCIIYRHCKSSFSSFLNSFSKRQKKRKKEKRLKRPQRHAAPRPALAYVQRGMGKCSDARLIHGGVVLYACTTVAAPTRSHSTSVAAANSVYRADY